MLKSVEVNKDGSWRQVHTYDEYAVMKDCYEKRMSGTEGWLGNKSGKMIARIPRHRLYSDIELQLYTKYKGKDDVEARKWLDKWLENNPEFKTTTGGRATLS